jgi:HSP20 family molecular chaperone IbpA
MTKEDKNKEKALEVKQPEMINTGELERTRDTQCFVPRTDIYETEDEIVVVADIPGADDKSVDITLEKNILTIDATTEQNVPDGYDLSHGEFATGDYRRSFRISSEVDRDKIKASVKNGELYLHLPKAAAAKAKKIQVKAG